MFTERAYDSAVFKVLLNIITIYSVFRYALLLRKLQ